MPTAQSRGVTAPSVLLKTLGVKRLTPKNQSTTLATNKKLTYHHHTMTNTIQVWNPTIIGDEVRDVEYTFKYTPPVRGSRDYFGQRIEPDEPASFHFVSATDGDNNEVEVDKYDIEVAEQLAADEIEAEQED
jgi:hypothetical protein